MWDADFPIPTGFPRTLWNQTIRQIAAVSIGGKRVRVVLSNEYGTRPLVIGAAHLAVSSKGAAIEAGVGSGAYLRRTCLHYDPAGSAGHQRPCGPYRGAVRQPCGEPIPARGDTNVYDALGRCPDRLYRGG